MKLNFKILLLFLLNCFCLLTTGQTVKVLTESTKTSLRGLSVANDKVIWVSGSNGMVGKSIDGGATWKWIVVKGFEKTDFRDIEAFDSMTALIMGIAEPAYILKTVDGGETWKVVLENKSKGMFLDAMDFWNERSGIVLGDPIDNTFFIARTFDGGDTWQNMPEQNKLPADSGEACFASSGTNIRALNNNEAIFISGGLKSNLFVSNKKTPLPILQGKESTGANSIAIKNKKIFIVVGGDFMAKDSIDKNCCITKNGGLSWAAPVEPPHGYRSCVEYLGKSKWVCTGLNGVDYSENEGKTWKWISTESFHVCKKAKKGNAVFFAGSNGKIGKLVFN
jgi:hypothetical protein